MSFQKVLVQSKLGKKFERAFNSVHQPLVGRSFSGVVFGLVRVSGEWFESLSIYINMSLCSTKKPGNGFDRNSVNRDPTFGSCPEVVKKQHSVVVWTWKE